MNRYFKDGEQEEINKRFDNGGILWFIERTDTNQFFYEPLLLKSSNDPFVPDENTGWSNTLTHYNLTGAFLNKEDAEKYDTFTECGCRYCGNGATKIPTKITEHEFVK